MSRRESEDVERGLRNEPRITHWNSTPPETKDDKNKIRNKRKKERAVKGVPKKKREVGSQGAAAAPNEILTCFIPLLAFFPLYSYTMAKLCICGGRGGGASTGQRSSSTSAPPRQHIPPSFCTTVRGPPIPSHASSLTSLPLNEGDPSTDGCLIFNFADSYIYLY